MRSPLGIGAVALVLIAAAVGGAVAVKGMVDDAKDTQSVASTATDAPTGDASNPPARFTKVGDSSGGTLEKATLAGRASGVSADVWVWRPPQYDDPANKDRSFPVLVAQSALPGTGANSFVDGSMSFLPKLADAIAAGTLPPFVVVAPELLPYTSQEIAAAGGSTTSIDTECSDIPGSPRMATFHNDDVRKAILGTYRVSADRESWAQIGDGSGGLCAVKYALQYPQYYATAVSLSGRVNLRSPLWNTQPAAVRDAADPSSLLAGRPDVRILLSAHPGTSDTQFAAKANAPTVVEIEPAPSGNSSDVVRQLPEAFTFLGTHTKSP